MHFNFSTDPAYYCVGAIRIRNNKLRSFNISSLPDSSHNTKYVIIIIYKQTLNYTYIYIVHVLQAAIPTVTASFSSTGSPAWSGPKCRWTTKKNPCTDYRWPRRTTDIRPNRRFACSGSRCSTWTTTDPRSPVPVSCFRCVLFSSTKIIYNI